MTQLIQPRTISRIKHIHRRQPPGRISRHRHQHPLQPLDQSLDSGRIEHIRTELDHAADAGRGAGLAETLSEGEHQIHTGGSGLRIERRGLDFAQI
ncbi:hypothetical protein MBOE_04090 [Mycolicibacterium boenickei]|uniref:Uncharacterized protein n=1 Tax=Mycolicibacterium boenickei TaxID=146017 RepID=A0ABM7IPQ2_9MYCO|nr:hypothetical protein MBOE_04090 [Mycolicibacterium boenickei]